MQPVRRKRNSALLALVFLASAPFAHASTTSGTIDSTHKYAWSSEGGWINLAPTNAGISVTDSALSGYAWSTNDGWINFSPTHSGVTNDSNGNLGGFAWDSTLGWVSFTGVTIDSSGKFHGQAVGANETITFDCTNCDVQTDWRPASSRTTPSSGGAWPSPATTTPPYTAPASIASPVSKPGSATPGTPAVPPFSSYISPSGHPANATSNLSTHPVPYPGATTTAPLTRGTDFFKRFAIPIGIAFILILVVFLILRIF